MKRFFKLLLLLILPGFACWRHLRPEEQEYAMPEQNTGGAQSPINILTSGAVEDKQDDVSVSFHAPITTVENLGHTVQLSFREGSTCTIEGKICTARQLHFHTPSEHLIDGVTYPMEMHLVSTIKDPAGQQEPSYVVIGVLFKMGKENRFLREFEDLIPAGEGERDLDSATVNLQDLLTQIAADHPLPCFTYTGSLTTAPYTEKVDWIVLDHVIEASPRQIMEIEKREGDNARHIQMPSPTGLSPFTVFQSLKILPMSIRVRLYCLVTGIFSVDLTVDTMYRYQYFVLPTFFSNYENFSFNGPCPEAYQRK